MFLITLDFSSHYIHMYMSLVTGSSSHKTVTSDVSRILWYYYNDPGTLFTICFANEVCFVCAYLSAFEKTSIRSSVLVKWLNEILPLRNLTYATPAALDAIMDTLGTISWAQLLFWLTMPICALKQVINVVQFWKASKIVSTTTLDWTLLLSALGTDACTRSSSASTLPNVKPLEKRQPELVAVGKEHFGTDWRGRRIKRGGCISDSQPRCRTRRKSVVRMAGGGSYQIPYAHDEQTILVEYNVDRPKINR